MFAYLSHVLEHLDEPLLVLGLGAAEEHVAGRQQSLLPLLGEPEELGPDPRSVGDVLFEIKKKRKKKNKTEEEEDEESVTSGTQKTTRQMGSKLSRGRSYICTTRQLS